MAKARVEVFCSECGTSIIKTADRDNRRDADQWESWAKSENWLCPKCWGEQKRAEEAARGLVLDIDIVADYMHMQIDHERIIRLSFAGDTLSHKEEIKAMDYGWEDKEDISYLGALSMYAPKKAWQKYILIDEMDAEIEAAKAIGAKIGKVPAEMDMKMAAAAIKHYEDWQTEKQATYDKEISKLEKPVPPEVWVQKINGHKTNRKIYGYKTKSVYVDGEKIELTDDEAKALEKYWVVNDEYKAAVAAIKNRYNVK